MTTASMETIREDLAGVIRVAWLVSIEDTTCVVFAETAPKARWQAVRAWRDAGYGSDGRWPRPGSRRAPEYDKSPLRLESLNRCFSEDAVQRGCL